MLNRRFVAVVVLVAGFVSAGAVLAGSQVPSATTMNNPAQVHVDGADQVGPVTSADPAPSVSEVQINAAGRFTPLGAPGLEIERFGPAGASSDVQGQHDSACPGGGPCGP